MSRLDADSEPVYFICHSDARARQAHGKLMAAGHENVVNVTGGTIAWAGHLDGKRWQERS